MSGEKVLDWLFNAIGLMGVGGILFGYFMLQSESWSSKDVPYLLANLAGATGILISLIRSWNLPTFVIEVVWVSLSLYGLWKAF